MFHWTPSLAQPIVFNFAIGTVRGAGDSVEHMPSTVNYFKSNRSASENVDSVPYQLLTVFQCFSLFHSEEGTVSASCHRKFELVLQVVYIYLRKQEQELFTYSSKNLMFPSVERNH